MVIDGHLVVTGSFNFTKSVDARNTENAVLIESREVAREFQPNWESRKAASRAFEVAE